MPSSDEPQSSRRDSVASAQCHEFAGNLLQQTVDQSFSVLASFKPPTPLCIPKRP
jgi:hypothetical protein